MEGDTEWVTKSQALDLHEDAIQVEGSGWKPPSAGGEKVLFRPFSGVAPRMYKRSFTEDRDLKNKDTGVREFGDPIWGRPWHLRRVSYVAQRFATASKSAWNTFEIPQYA